MRSGFRIICIYILLMSAENGTSNSLKFINMKIGSLCNSILMYKVSFNNFPIDVLALASNAILNRIEFDSDLQSPWCGWRDDETAVVFIFSSFWPLSINFSANTPALFSVSYKKFRNQSEFFLPEQRYESSEFKLFSLEGNFIMRRPS